jgi:hypothetical protein
MSMKNPVHPLRSALLALAVLAVSASMAAASQSSWALQNAATRMSHGWQVAATHVTAPAAVTAMTNAASHAQAGLATATSNVTAHAADDVVAGANHPTGSRPTTPSQLTPASDEATNPLDALTAAGEAAHAGLAKAGDALTNNPTSSDSNAWTGLDTASAAVDAGLAKAAEAVSAHH